MKITLIFALWVIGSALIFAEEKPELIKVNDVEARKALEAEWIFNKSLKLTAYYPTRSTMQKAQQFIKAKGIKEEKISEMLYYSLDGGRHVLFMETDQKEESVRYHCLGFDKDENVKIYWVQFQPNRTETKIEKIEQAKAEPHKNTELSEPK